MDSNRNFITGKYIILHSHILSCLTLKTYAFGIVISILQINIIQDLEI